MAVYLTKRLAQILKLIPIQLRRFMRCGIIFLMKMHVFPKQASAFFHSESTNNTLALLAERAADLSEGTVCESLTLLSHTSLGISTDTFLYANEHLIRDPSQSLSHFLITICITWQALSLLVWPTKNLHSLSLLLLCEVN